jgi:hypothetical protein
VHVVIEGTPRTFEAADAASAYGRALLAYIDESIGDPLPGIEDELPTA